MDKVCDKCRALASSYPPLKEGENVYTKILLNQKDDHEECMKALLEAGADMNAEKSYSGNALVQAAILGHVKRLQTLIRAGADVHKHYDVVYYCERYVAVDEMEQENALTNAVSKGYTDCVEVLIKAGANVNKVGNKEISVLRLAVEKDNVTCADLLIKAGASVNGERRPIYTPLYYAIKNKAHRCLDLLLRSGADVHVTGVEGLTALMLVKDEKCCRSLLKHHTQINRRDCFGYNALSIHMSRYPINKDLCPLLFAAGETAPETVKGRFQSDKPINVSYYLPQIQMKFDLKHLCRGTIRKHMLEVDPHTHLFDRVPMLGLPSLLVEYLLYDMSLYARKEDEDGNDKAEPSVENDHSDGDRIKDIVDD